MSVWVGARPTGVDRAGKEVAGGPEELHSGPLLELESEVCHLVKVPVGLLKGTAHRRDVPGECKLDEKNYACYKNN